MGEEKVVRKDTTFIDQTDTLRSHQTERINAFFWVLGQETFIAIASCFVYISPFTHSNEFQHQLPTAHRTRSTRTRASPAFAMNTGWFKVLLDRHLRADVFLSKMKLEFIIKF